MRALGATLLLLVAAGPAAAQMIKWVDAKGTVHFAETLGEIPPEFRPAAEKIPEYSPDDPRVRIIPNEPDEQERGWFGFGGSKPDADGAKSTPATAGSKSGSSGARSC